MMDISALIDEAIRVMANRPVVFSVQDVTDYADLASSSDAVAVALKAHCNSGSALLLDELRGSGSESRHYLGREQAERWWIDSTLRWARAGVRQLATANLASEMSLAFDVRRWTAAPRSLLSVGRRFALVADGSQPDTFVFPWAAVICASPGSAKQLHPCINYLRNRAVSGELQHRFSNAGLCEAVGQILAFVTEREADILKGRLGLENGESATLEQLGRKHGVTRERIRQIQQKALRKLHHPSRRQNIWFAFAEDFVKSSGRLILPEGELTPWRQFVNGAVGLKTAHVPQIGLHFIGKDGDFATYRKALMTSDTQENASRYLDVLSYQDSALVREAEERYRTSQTPTTRAYMLREALRSLGRAAHYEEIVQECHRLFPDKVTSARSWHAALSGCAHPTREELGIVWIGVKGTYGLKEHGYSRPDADLFTQVADIVESIFGRTGKPVSETTVISELANLRRESKVISVKMALGINDRLEAEYGGFIPKGSKHAQPSDAESPQYDIDAAFAAFAAYDKLDVDKD